MHHSSTSTYAPNFCWNRRQFLWTDGPTDEHSRPALLGRLRGVDLITLIMRKMRTTHHSDGVWLQQLRSWENREVGNISEDVDDGDERNWDIDCTRQVPASQNEHVYRQVWFSWLWTFLLWSFRDCYYLKLCFNCWLLVCFCLLHWLSTLLWHFYILLYDFS